MVITPRIRLFVLAIIPLILSAAVMSTLVAVSTEQRLAAQSNHFAKTVTAYLAMTTAKHLINNDLLGINILLTRLQEDGALDFASVYGTDNQLIAQVGQQSPTATAVISREVTFQDTAAGYIQVGFNDQTITQYQTYLVGLVLLFHLAVALFLAGLIFFAGDFVAVWIFNTPNKTPGTKADLDHEEPAEGEDASPQQEMDGGAAILVIKLRPVRLLDKHKAKLSQAVSLHGGKLADHGDDLIVQFQGKQGIFKASCAALLLLTLIRHLGPPLKLKLGIHWLDDMADDLALEKASKHTSYLASISEQMVLVSRAFEEQLSDQTDIGYEPYLSSLTPDGEVFLISRVKNQALIDSQALQLINARL